MKICDICNVLFNMSLGLDYADGADSHKEELDILETEIKEIKDNNKSLYYVLESIAEQNKDFKNFPVNSDGGFTRWKKKIY